MMEDLLKRTVEMSFANYIMNIYEYISVIEEDIRIPGRGIDRWRLWFWQVASARNGMCL